MAHSVCYSLHILPAVHTNIPHCTYASSPNLLLPPSWAMTSLYHTSTFGQPMLPWSPHMTLNHPTPRERVLITLPPPPSSSSTWTRARREPWSFLRPWSERSVHTPAIIVTCTYHSTYLLYTCLLHPTLPRLYNILCPSIHLEHLPAAWSVMDLQSTLFSSSSSTDCTANNYTNYCYCTAL